LISQLVLNREQHIALNAQFKSVSWGIFCGGAYVSCIERGNLTHNGMGGAKREEKHVTNNWIAAKTRISILSLK
jgi:hypothetical protein